MAKPSISGPWTSCLARAYSQGLLAMPRRVGRKMRYSKGRVAASVEEGCKMHVARPRVLAASRPAKPIIIGAADMLVAVIASVAALVARRGHFEDLDTYLTYWIASVV